MLLRPPVMVPVVTRMALKAETTSIIRTWFVRNRSPLKVDGTLTFRTCPVSWLLSWNAPGMASTRFPRQ